MALDRLAASIALLVLLAVGCTSGNTSSPESSAAVGVPASPATGTETPVPLPEPTSNLAPREPSPTYEPPFGSWIIDVGTGSAVRVGDDVRSRLVLRNDFRPRFTADGTGVWLGRERWPDARRYALDGTISERIDGAFSVREGPIPGIRTYYEVFDDDDTETLVFGVAGDSQSISGRTALSSIAPDGESVAFYSISEQNDADLILLDRSGHQLTVATGVDPCPCDLTPRPDWSPSGSHIAYYDFSGNEGGNALGWATFLVDVQTGERRHLADMAPPGRSPGWLSSEAGERLVVTHEHRVAVFDLVTGTELPLELGEGEEASSAVVVAGRYVEVHSVRREGDRFVGNVTTLFDGVTGSMLERWDLQGAATWSADGAALVLNHYQAEDEGCLGVLVAHPTLAKPACLEGAHSALWSPDGSMLAVISHVDAGRKLSLWDAENGLRDLAVVDTGDLVDWNAQGTHVLVSDVNGV